VPHISPPPQQNGSNPNNLIRIHISKITDSPFSKAKIGLLNARSVMNKSEAIVDHIVDNELDVLTLTETWVPAGCKDDPRLKDLLPIGYTMSHAPRQGRRGGGVAIIHRKEFSKRIMPSCQAKSFEILEVTLTNASSCIRVVVIYRPPPSKKNGFTKVQFLEGFSDLLDSLNSTTGKLIILGDFNYHWDKRQDPDTVQFSELLDNYSLQQHVQESTHISGHCLDLIISRSSDNFISSTEVSSLVSDHHAIHCFLQLKKPPLSKESITFRKYKLIDPVNFREDLMQSPLVTSPHTTLDHLLDQYNCTLSNLINSHAPLKSKVITLRPATPWHSPDIALAKRNRQKCEQRWRKSGLTVHREAYIHQRNNVNYLIIRAKSEYYNQQVRDCPDQKSLFKLLNHLLHRNENPPLPSYDSLEDLLAQFSDFF
jgi:exonuclease III